MNDEKIRDLNIEIHNLIIGINEMFNFELPDEVSIDVLEEIRSSLLEVLETISYAIDEEE